MGTRGFIGFVIDDIEKIAYNHWDSYPEGLGANTLTWLRLAARDIESLAKSARNLRVVGFDSTPTPEDVERLAKYSDTNVGDQRIDDWYCLLRRTQGNLGEMVAAGVIQDAGTFPQESLFAEWGYIVNLDTQVFEVYKGFQKEPHSLGRFADRTGADGYQPVALAASWPLDKLPADEDFMSKFTDKEDDE